MIDIEITKIIYSEGCRDIIVGCSGFRFINDSLHLKEGDVIRMHPPIAGNSAEEIVFKNKSYFNQH